MTRTKYRGFIWKTFMRLFPAKNRRHFKRAKAPFLLRYQVEESGVGHITNVRDLSVGGVLFSSDHPLLKGSLLNMQINLPTSEAPLSVRAEVVRTARLKHSDLYRVGTRFIGLKSKDHTSIRLLIERMMRDKRVSGLVNRKRRIWVKTT